MDDKYQTRQTLIEKVKNQYSDSSWEEFVYFYQKFIYSIIRKSGMNAEDSEDLTQKTLLKIWKALPKFEYDKNKGGFRYWLYRVTRNVINSHLEKVYKTNERISRFQNQKEIEEEVNENSPEVVKAADKEWEIHITNLAFEKIRKSMAEKSITIFQMCLEGVEARKIAEKTGVTEKSVYVYKKRVKEKLIAEIQALRDLLE